MAALTLFEACRRGDASAVRSMLVTDPAAVNAQDIHQWRPIFHAAVTRHEGIVRILIDAGADLAAEDGMVMHCASQVRDNADVLALLLQYGGLTAYTGAAGAGLRQLLGSVLLGNSHRVSALLNQDARLVHTRDGRGDLAIHHAVRCGDPDVVSALIHGGADVNARNLRGQTVLYCAAAHRHLDVVRLLLCKGADARVKFPTDGETILDWLEQFPRDDRYRAIVEILTQTSDPFDLDQNR